MAAVTKPLPSNLLASLIACSGFTESDVRRVWTAILEEMVILYYPPFRASDEVELTYLAEVGLRAYVADLCEFKPDVLANGWAAARRAHKTERWPTIGAIRDQCLVTGMPAAIGGNVTQMRDPEWRLWKVRMNGFPWSRNWWPDQWGPRPGHEGCRVPPDLLPSGYRQIEAQQPRSVLPEGAA